MKSYSKANLLGSSFHSNSGNTGTFIKAVNLLSQKFDVRFRIDIPYSVYLRGETFCDDIQELSGEKFTNGDLIKILYHDFVMYIIKKPDLKRVYQLLMERYDRIYNVQKPRRLEIIPYNTPEKLIINDQRGTSTYDLEDDDYVTLKVYLSKKYALRGEVVLADLAEIYPDHPFTLEKVLEIIYIDFVEKFRRGELQDAVVNILNFLEE